MKRSHFLTSLTADPIYRLGDPIFITFSIENTSGEAYQVLKWGTPLEGQFTRDCFKVERDGRLLPYDGKFVSRGDPMADSYVVIDAGQKLEERIDISDAYAIDRVGEYTVTLKASLFDVFKVLEKTKLTPRRRHHHERQELPSATVHFKIVEGIEPKLTEGQIARKKVKLADTSAKAPSFNGGTTNEQDEVANAHNNAQYFAALSASQLDSTTANTNTLYQTWFGAFQQSRYDTVTKVFNDVNNNLITQQVTYDLTGSGCGIDWNAYTYNGSNTVWTCNGFWTMPPIAIDCQFSTILHEWTHAVCGTDDHAYGDTDCQNLAANNPDDAVDNADSYENFAERLAQSDFGKTLTFITDRSQFGHDEVDALLADATPATVEKAFYVHADGFWPDSLGITATSLGAMPNVNPTLSMNPTIAGMTVEVTSLEAEDPSLPVAPQRFTWVLCAKFTNSSGFPSVANTEQIVTLTAELSGHTASAQIRLIKEASPYELDGPISWLSTDLRVFQIRAGETRFGATMGSTPADASTFIKQVIANLQSGTSGGQTFESISTDQQTSALELSQQVNGTKIFNFAVAKARYVGTMAISNVRMFFRMFPVSTTSTAFAPGTTYRRNTQGATAIPVLGLSSAGDLLSIPFFAEPRVDSATTALSSQTDPSNVKPTMAASPSSGESVGYFGAWIDINQTDPQFPSTPSPVDGPWSSGRKTVQELIVNAHQCLVAEIAYDSDPIAIGASPGGSDKLAQRNLSIVPSANPGEPGSHRIPNVFELWPAPSTTKTQNAPDELLIDWGHTPQGSTASIYIPEINASQIVSLANKRYATHTLKQLDEQTIQLPVGGISYIPLPSGATFGLTGLLWVDLPDSVCKGEVYTIVVSQVTDETERQVPVLYDESVGHATEYLTTVPHGPTELLRWRRIVGSYQITIPVRSKAVILPHETRLLSVLRWILRSLQPDDRWFKVFSRYVGLIGERVRALGGDPNLVEASPAGTGGKTEGVQPQATERMIGHDGKVTGLIYDCFGDFEGFVLNKCCSEVVFKVREHQIEALVRLAWERRIAITVLTNPKHPRCPVSIILRRAPEPFQA